ncbi:MAG TPA: nickel-responsive transcriptional regulator NikR [Labilithrix sp.]|nr:nickel-responsive transcriptional regulator NikR [Labilithrix sp.]
MADGKDSLVRFGVAMEGSLLAEFDALVEDRGGSRSELLRDLVRAEVTRARVSAGANAVAALTLVYDHHVRDLTERLTEFQHALGEKVNSALHVHLDHDYCLEVIVMRGPSDELKRAGDKLLATRGVKHGGMELIAISPPDDAKQAPRSTPHRAHDHAHSHHHAHADHDAHPHDHDHAPRPKRKSVGRRVRKGAKAT